ncbi:MAG TPA: peptidylprolyl isomerase [Sorangium sp.]|uniref:peptidyl-prolyl cis-trans isomerase n=1 Tax=Sorangium sp. So ce1153 TaxID=3133333 RepID=UPI002BBD89DE|nr:peptidylprolyl isomerase [Sorangium sp.]
MQRSTAVIYTLFFAGAVAFVIANSGPKGRGAASAPADAGANADGGSPAAAAAPADGDAGTDAGGEGLPEVAPEQPTRSDAGVTLLSGEAPPGLPTEAPKKVRFGVVLVQYRGAQGAPPTARSKEAALALARELSEVARTDWKAAVDKGDKGSTDDLGFIPRGVLEPAPEYELFSLPKGGVSGPVDTPRGFWITRRIE